MADTSLIIGNGNWAVKETSLLGYNIIQSKYVPIEMTVSRATTATRVNSAGFIELVPRNLLTYSEQFDNAVWTKVNITVTANSVIAPNGTLTADLITLVDSTSRLTQNLTLGAGTYTLSVYVKKEGGSGTCRLRATVDGTITTLLNFLPTSTWQRFEITFTANLSVTDFNFRSTDAVGNFSLWGAQLEQGTTATEYFPTTDRFNIPRVDYSTGTASLLVEPARTNNVLYSEQFDNVYWVKNLGGVASAPVVTPNVETAPDGTTTADRVVFNLNGGTASGDFSQLDSAVFTSISITRTQSVYIKTTDGTTKIFSFVSPTGTLTTITVTSVYQRFTFTSTGINSSSIRLRLRGGEGTSTSATIAIWGAQYEDGSNATSYIPTTTIPLVRNADVISKTGISSLIGQTEGTIFVEANLTANTSDRRIITIGTEFQRIMFWTSGTILYVNFNAVGVNLGNFPIGTAKIALGYTIGASSTTYSIKLNNNTLITGTANAAPSSLSAIYLGSTVSGTLILNDRIESATLFLTRLTDQQLANLTAI